MTWHAFHATFWTAQYFNIVPPTALPTATALPATRPLHHFLLFHRQSPYYGPLHAFGACTALTYTHTHPYHTPHAHTALPHAHHRCAYTPLHIPGAPHAAYQHYPDCYRTFFAHTPTPHRTHHGGTLLPRGCLPLPTTHHYYRLLRAAVGHAPALRHRADNFALRRVYCWVAVVVTIQFPVRGTDRSGDAVLPVGSQRDVHNIA